ncbi:hypothetical protein LWI28_028555 [Acer negundo]|uniref:High affinity nitrate transporter n=1 Tax=Acer negundo TaxID=4023 RepID=A0AAD5NNI6_ACENE|nr:hypothetical protein LWI28_028555 [Acer negundo]
MDFDTDLWLLFRGGTNNRQHNRGVFLQWIQSETQHCRDDAASFGLANVTSRPVGGIVSDLVSKRFGMRGRLWALWVVQTLGGVFCVILELVGSLTVSIVVMIVFSVFIQTACGLTSLDVISGMTGGGGNVGAVLTQLIFFKGTEYTKERGITLMGLMIICCSLPIMFIYFPQWGGMFCGPSKIVATEEDYYLSEWNSDEKGEGSAPGKSEIC